MAEARELSYGVRDTAHMESSRRQAKLHEALEEEMFGPDSVAALGSE